MPLHDYKCSACRGVREVFLRIADLGASVYCQVDGTQMTRQLSAPYIQTDYASYESPVVPGKWIHGRRQHEEHLLETGCRVVEGGETQAHAKGLKREEAAFDKLIDDTAEELIAALPAAQKEQLASEMQAGVTTEIVRG